MNYNLTALLPQTFHYSRNKRGTNRLDVPSTSPISGHCHRFACMYLMALLKIVIPSPSCLFFRRDQCGCWVGRTCLSGCGISLRTLPVVSVKPDRLKTSKRHCLTILIPSFLFCSLSLWRVCFLPSGAGFRFLFYFGF